jgi:hypothetical protein
MMSDFTQNAETVEHYLYFMMWCVVGREGGYVQEEIDVITERANTQIARLASKKLGIPLDAAHARAGMLEGDITDRRSAILEEVMRYYEHTLNRGTVQLHFATIVQLIPIILDYEEESLTDLYTSLVNVAEADGEIGFGELNLLDLVKEEWGI